MGPGFDGRRCCKEHLTRTYIHTHARPPICNREREGCEKESRLGLGGYKDPVCVDGEFGKVSIPSSSSWSSVVYHSHSFSFLFISTVWSFD